MFSFNRLAVVVSDYGVAKEVFIRDGKYVSDRARIGVPHLRESNPYYPKTGTFSLLPLHEFIIILLNSNLLLAACY